LPRARLVAAGVTTVAGAAVLGWSFNVEPGTGRFTLAATVLAAIWITGAVVARRPTPAGATAPTRPVRSVIGPSLAVGLALATVFLAGAVIVRQIDLLADTTGGVLEFARRGSGPAVLMVTVVNGVAEEAFFRGALYDLLPARHAVAVTTLVYVVVTLASGNLMLAFAALIVGTVLGVTRRGLGPWTAAAIAHVTWSVTMLVALPHIIPA
jgi:membrane protease YdiL (CAAX protease family)